MEKKLKEALFWIGVFSASGIVAGLVTAWVERTYGIRVVNHQATQGGQSNPPMAPPTQSPAAPPDPAGSSRVSYGY